MRMSCNGCRVLRKGCNEDCVLRPCLQWIKSPEAQANATVFLAKFYGRAGLLNLLNAGPHHLRPAIFRSLLHEACGRIINPIYGSVGLMWSGNWELCQSAVDSVLEGSPIMQIPSNNLEAVIAPNPIMPLKGCDIRHLSKHPSSESHRIPIRKRSRRSGGGGDAAATTLADVLGIEEQAKFSISGWKCEEQDVKRAPSHDDDSGSDETVEVSLIDRVDPVWDQGVKSESQSRRVEDESEDLLELTLG